MPKTQRGVGTVPLPHTLWLQCGVSTASLDRYAGNTKTHKMYVYRPIFKAHGYINPHRVF